MVYQATEASSLKSGDTMNWSIGWNSRPPAAAPSISVAISGSLVLARMGRILFGRFGLLFALDFLSGAEHRLHPRRKAQHYK
mmetsp:Transcript_4341/g.5675  ORF Transcript_4341/g.5675 Transcript_4341/m.5675 type:complete len:82 (-) Transcript_4341:91-336(-)